MRDQKRREEEKRKREKKRKRKRRRREEKKRGRAKRYESLEFGMEFEYGIVRFCLKTTWVWIARVFFRH